MSLKGGYKIIDLKGTNLTTAEAVTITGIYDKIENSYHKPLLLSGIVIDDVEKNDVYVQPQLSSTSYVFELYGYTLTITDEDSLTLATKE